MDDGFDGVHRAVDRFEDILSLTFIGATCAASAVMLWKIYFSGLQLPEDWRVDEWGWLLFVCLLVNTLAFVVVHFRKMLLPVLRYFCLMTLFGVGCLIGLMGKSGVYIFGLMALMFSFHLWKLSGRTSG